MTSLDLDRLLAPLDGAPCGPDLRGEPDFRDIEDAPGTFANKKPAELKQTVEACLAFLDRSKDQMPAIVLLQAAVRSADLSMSTDALTLIKGYAEQYWEDFHPGPAEDMLIGRINELSALTRPAAMTLPLQRLVLARLAHPSTMEFNTQMIAQACQPTLEWSDADEETIKTQVESGQLAAAAARSMRPIREGGRALRTVVRVLSATERSADDAAGVTIDDPREPTQARLQALEIRSQIAAMRANLGAISDLFYEIAEIYQSKGGDSPGFGPVLSQLNAMTGECDRFLAAFPEAEGGAEASTDGETDGSGGVISSAAASAAFTAGVPRNRDEVASALDSIIRYYAEAEPSSPVPIILKRIRGWVHKDFMQLIKDIAPNGVDEVRKLLASPDE